MSYLDALKKATKTQEVPYPNKGGTSEFIESDIGQPSDRKKRAQEKYNRLSPSQKKQVDALLEARRSKNPQNALVKKQDARNEAQQKMMSRLDYLNRQREVKRQEAETKAIEKQKRQIRLAEDKAELARTKEQQKISQAKAKINPDLTADKYFDSVDEGRLSMEDAEFERSQTIQEAEDKLKEDFLLFGRVELADISNSKDNLKRYNQEKATFDREMDSVKKAADLKYDRAVKTSQMKNDAYIRQLIRETSSKFDTFEDAQNYFRSIGLEREVSRILNEDKMRRGQ